MILFRGVEVLALQLPCDTEKVLCFGAVEMRQQRS
jgi:hypothetical protein